MMLGKQEIAYRGFTLMEVLVVLVLVALISGMLMQGFGYVLRLRLNVTQQLKNQRTEQLQEYWYRNLISGIIVNTIEEKPLFQGDASSLQAQSIATLHAAGGVPQLFSLTLAAQDGAIILRYKISEHEEWILGRWNATDASFSYLDNEGAWVTAWPPKLGLALQQLPNAVQLHIQRQPKPFTWIVAIPGRKNPKPLLEDILS